MPKSIIDTYIELLEKALYPIGYLGATQFAIIKNQDGTFTADIEGVLTASFTGKTLEDLYENGHEFSIGRCYTSYFGWGLIEDVGQKKIKKTHFSCWDHLLKVNGVTTLTGYISHLAECEKLQPKEIAARLRELKNNNYQPTNPKGDLKEGNYNISSNKVMQS